MTTRWLAFVIAAAVAVGAGSWALRLFAPAENAPPRATTGEPVASASSRTNMLEPGRSDRARLPSAYLPPSAPMSEPATTGDRFKLVGVVAPREAVAGSQWVAMIAVNGEQPRAFSIGATVDGDIVLRDVSARGAILGPREGSMAMALEVAPAPATGMAQMPTPGPVLESSDVPTGPPGRGSKYMVLPSPPEPPPVDRAAEAGDGRWRPPSGQ